MTTQDPSELVHQLVELQAEHRSLDEMIGQMTEEGRYADDLELRRLKKRKLQLKDAIEKLHSHLIPDLDA